MMAEVSAWGRTIGAIEWHPSSQHATFQYNSNFVESGIEFSPIKMPLSQQIYNFPQLPNNTFHGLPGLLADSLPDKFGNALIDAWLASQGKHRRAVSTYVF